MESNQKPEDDLLAAVEAYGLPGSVKKVTKPSPHLNKSTVANTPQSGAYFKIGTVDHRAAMNAFLKEASDYDKMSVQQKNEI